MAAPIPTSEPLSVVAGDSVLFKKTVSGYAASDGWLLTYAFTTPSGDQTFTFSSTASGSDFSISVVPATTAAWQPATYNGQARVRLLSSGETHVVWQGALTVLADFTKPGDNRSHVKIVLDNVQAVLQKRATREILNSEINGVRLDRIPTPDLVALESLYLVKYQSEVNAVRIAQGLGTGRKIFTRFRQIS